MPADLQISNAILNAFIAGKQDKLAREKQAQDKVESEERAKREQEQIKIEQDRLKQQQEQFNARMAVDKAQNDLMMMQARQKLGEDYLKTGIAPEGTNVIQQVPQLPQGSDPNLAFDPNIMGNSPGFLELENAILGKIRVPTFENYVQRQGQISEAQEAPKRLTRTQVEDIKAEARKENTDAVTQRQKDLQQVKLDVEKSENQKDRIHEIELAHIKGNYGLKARQITADKIKALPTAVGDKIIAFNLLEKKVQDFKAKLEARYGDGQTGAEKFYKGMGIGGTIRDVVESFGADKDTEDIRVAAADIEADAKNMIGKFGGALTRTELNILENMAPSPNRNLTPVRARSIVNGFLLGVQNIKGEYADLYKDKLGIKGTTASPRRIRVDEKGNEINATTK